MTFDSSGSDLQQKIESMEMVTCRIEPEYIKRCKKDVETPTNLQLQISTPATTSTMSRNH